MFKTVDELQAVGKERFETAAATTVLLLKGGRQIVAEATDYTKNSFVNALSLIEDLLAAGTLGHAIQIQSDYAKSARETFANQAVKFSELCSNLAKDAARPAELGVARSTIKSPAAKNSN